MLISVVKILLKGPWQKKGNEEAKQIERIVNSIQACQSSPEPNPHLVLVWNVRGQFIAEESRSSPVGEGKETPHVVENGQQCSDWQ